MKELTSVIAKEMNFLPARTSGMISFLRASDPKFMTGGSCTERKERRER